MMNPSDPRLAMKVPLPTDAAGMIRPRASPMTSSTTAPGRPIRSASNGPKNAASERTARAKSVLWVIGGHQPGLGVHVPGAGTLAWPLQLPAVMNTSSTQKSFYNFDRDRFLNGSTLRLDFDTDETLLNHPTGVVVPH